MLVDPHTDGRRLPRAAAGSAVPHILALPLDADYHLAIDSHAQPLDVPATEYHWLLGAPAAHAGTFGAVGTIGTVAGAGAAALCAATVPYARTGDAAAHSAAAG